MQAAEPSTLDFEGHAKWHAWTQLGKMPREDARAAYVAAVARLVEGAFNKPVYRVVSI